jgi:hypothetical protein
MVEANQRKRQYSRHTTVTPSLVGQAAVPRAQISFIVAKEGTRMHRRPPLKTPTHTPPRRPRAGAARRAAVPPARTVRSKSDVSPNWTCCAHRDRRVEYGLSLRRAAGVVNLAAVRIAGAGGRGEVRVDCAPGGERGGEGEGGVFLAGGEGQLNPLGHAGGKADWAGRRSRNERKAGERTEESISERRENKVERNEC